jgi:hypothetical protein
LNKIKVNTAPKDDIRKHPYLHKWEITTAIISSRDKAKLTNLDFLLTDDLMSQEQIDKVLPYIDFE